jgi:hypothetical protein
VYQIQDTLSFHSHPLETKAKAADWVSALGLKRQKKANKPGFIENHILTPSRDRRVEQLEKRLEWMEAQLKRTVKDQQFEPDVDPREKSRRRETPSAEESSPGDSYFVQTVEHNKSLDRSSTAAEASPQSSDLRLPSQNSNSILPYTCHS